LGNSFGRMLDFFVLEAPHPACSHIRIFIAHKFLEVMGEQARWHMLYTSMGRAKQMNGTTASVY